MIRYWTNFAKTGDPNGADLPAWPEYREGAETVMYLKGAQPKPISLPNAGKIQFMEDYFKWLREKS